MIRRLAAALALFPAVAGAGKLAALTAAPDAAHAVAIGPLGEAYLPDGHGAWTRTHPGGIATEVNAITHDGATVIAGTPRSPFRLDGAAWNAIHLGRNVATILGAGARPTAAVGKTIFVLDGKEPGKLAAAPAPVLALAASARTLVIATDTGLLRLPTTKPPAVATPPTAWKPIANAPTHVLAFVDERWAIVDRGAFDLDRGKLVALVATPQVAAASGDALFAVVGNELVTARGDKLDREPLPIAGVAVGIAADRGGRVVVAFANGQIAVRDHATWTSAAVRDELPPPRPGPAPALSR